LPLRGNKYSLTERISCWQGLILRNNAQTQTGL
jgi:hypothetical protein